MNNKTFGRKLKKAIDSSKTPMSKIKIIPHPDHVEDIKELYDKEIIPDSFLVKVKAKNGKTYNLKSDEYEIVKDKP